MIYITYIVSLGNTHAPLTVNQILSQWKGAPCPYGTSTETLDLGLLTQRLILDVYMMTLK